MQTLRTPIRRRFKKGLRTLAGANGPLSTMNPLPISDPVALRHRRQLHKCRCCEIALANTPPNVRVVQVRRSLTGKAYLKQGILAGPKPFTRKALYIFLHECAHFVLHGSGHKPSYVKEKEAPEQWAHAKMREAGMPVPRAMTRRANAAKSAARSDTERNGLIPPHDDMRNETCA